MRGDASIRLRMEQLLSRLADGGARVASRQRDAMPWLRSHFSASAATAAPPASVKAAAIRPHQRPQRGEQPLAGRGRTALLRRWAIRINPRWTAGVALVGVVTAALASWFVEKVVEVQAAVQRTEARSPTSPQRCELFAASLRRGAEIAGQPPGLACGPAGGVVPPQTARTPAQGAGLRGRTARSWLTPNPGGSGRGSTHRPTAPAHVTRPRRPRPPSAAGRPAGT